MYHHFNNVINSTNVKLLCVGVNNRTNAYCRRQTLTSHVWLSLLTAGLLIPMMMEKKELRFLYSLQLRRDKHIDTNDSFYFPPFCRFSRRFDPKAVILFVLIHVMIEQLVVGLVAWINKEQLISLGRLWTLGFDPRTFWLGFTYQQPNHWLDQCFSNGGICAPRGTLKDCRRCSEIF